jgi:predicted P-loop ATPase
MPRKKLTPEQKAEAEAKAVAILSASNPSPDQGDGPSELVTRIPVEWPEWSRSGPKKSMMNALAAISALGINCKLDVFHNRKTINGTNLGGFVGDVSDMVTRKFREMSFVRLGLDPGGEASYDAINRECEEHRYDPVLDYLTGLPEWDGVPRLGKWLTTYCGVKSTPLVDEQGRIVLVAAVQRIHEHGCKFDHVLVLEGPEGARKSSVVQVLASGRHGSNENFSDSPILHTDERKQQELTRGVWFYEIAELAGMKKADQFAVKNFISKQEERARPAYGRFEEIQPRVCVFIGTFNTTPSGELIEYLNAGDQRRWWPVLVGDIDIEGLERDRDQLFAEAMFEYQLLGTPLYLPPSLETEARAIAATREQPDMLAEKLSGIESTVLAAHRRKQSDAFDGLRVQLTTRGDKLFKCGEAEAFAMVLKPTETEEGLVWVSTKYVVECSPPSRQNDGKGIAAAMRKLGWDKVEDRRSGGPKNRRGFVWKLACEVDPTT